MICRYCGRQIEGPDAEGDYHLDVNVYATSTWNCPLAPHTASPLVILLRSHESPWPRHSPATTDEVKFEIASYL